MRNIAFIIALLGIIALALLVLFQTPINIYSSSDLINLEDNQKVTVSGNVTNEYIASYSRTLTLDNNITLYCSCKSIPSLKGKSILATGVIDTYQRTKINVLNVKW
jgi:hypothetical protein